MNKSLTLLLLSFFCLSAPVFASKLPDTLLNTLEENWYCVTVNDHLDMSGLCVIRGQVTFTWYELDHYGLLTPLKYQPSIGISPAKILLSPDEKMVALLYADEGHPVIVVHNINKMLGGIKDSLFGQGVYPGGLDLECWQGNNIILQSDQDLTQDWHNADAEVTGGGVFQLNPVSYKITRVGNNTCKKKVKKQ